MTGKKVLSFVHVSDIHFRKESGDPYDIDNELRTAMINDLRLKAKQDLRNVCGVLVCGDLAYSGKQEEYDKANEFLEEVTSIFDISIKDVCCVAGNHDVDQSMAKDSKLLECIQDYIASIANSNNVDSEIRKIQNDQFIEGLLYKPLAVYNTYAEKMSSSYTIDKPNWQTELELDDGYKLIVYGMNSVLSSGYKDHLDECGNRLVGSERKMVINRNQIPIPYENVIYLTLCHHPPECWNNSSLVEYMDSRVMIQLYGHKHLQDIDANEKRIRISSGALQPERGKDWIPRYNWIEIWKDVEKLKVKIYPRIYNSLEGKFVPDNDSCDEGVDYRLVELRLSRESMVQQDTECAKSDMIRTTNVTTKEIVYRFSILSVLDKKRLLKQFPIIRYADGMEVDALLQQLKEKDIETDFLDAMKQL